MRNELHEKWEASGQTIRAWCLENGVKNDRMYYWRRKLRLSEGSSQPIASQWLPLEVTDSRVAASDSVIIHIGKASVEASSKSDRSLLIDIVRTLVELC